jgi:hypothetical protein
MAKNVAEETASLVALARHKILGNAAKTMSEWSNRRAEAKRKEELTIILCSMIVYYKFASF